MKIIIEAEPIEIAALVVALQERQNHAVNITLDGTVIAQKIAN